MLYIDSHCHIDLYDDPIGELFEASSSQVGVVAVTNAPFVFKACCDLVDDRENVWVAIGLHPELVGQYAHQVDDLVKNLDKTRFVGEVGLDYRVTDPATHGSQRVVFERIVAACQRKPTTVMTVHSRGAEADILSIVGPKFSGTAILHWYSGPVKLLDQALERGFFFSVNSSMLMSKSGKRLISRMDRSRVLTESDGPFVNVRGKRARPRDIPSLIDGLAAIWGESPEAAQSTVMSNWTSVLKA